VYKHTIIAIKLDNRFAYDYHVDLSSFRIFVEADTHNERKNLVLKQFLERKGYSFLYHDHPNDWFVNPDFDEIYGHIVY